MFRYISSGHNVPPAAGPYSPAVVAGNQCFLSGQIALLPETGKLIAGSVADEVEQAMNNLFATAEAAGVSPSEIAIIYLLMTDVSGFEEANKAYAACLPQGHLPARMTFETSALPLGARVEVQGVAVRTAE